MRWNSEFLRLYLGFNMFGVLKKLFGHRTEAEPFVGETGCVSTVDPENFLPSDSQNRVAALPLPPPPPGGGEVEVIDLPLKPIIDQMPGTLRATVKRALSTDDRVQIPVKTVLAQLPQGRVKITLGELRRGAPADLFSNSSQHDHTLIDLPMQEVVCSLGVGRLVRRTNQKRVEVSEAIFPLFGPSNCPQTVSDAIEQGAKPAADASHTTSANGQPLIKLRLQSDSGATATNGANLPEGRADESRTDEFSSKATLPAARGEGAGLCFSAKLLDSKAALSAIAPRELKATPATSAARPEQKQTVAPSGGGIANAVKHPVASAEVWPASVRTVSPEEVLPVAERNFLDLPLASVAASWPETIRRELSQISLEKAQLQLPLADLERALKRGKVSFRWKQLRNWIQPPLPSVPETALLETTVELPLGVIAPKFLARRKPVVQQNRRYEISDGIPHLFGRAPSKGPTAKTALSGAEASFTAKPAQEPVEPVSAATESSTAQAENVAPLDQSSNGPNLYVHAPVPMRGPELGNIFGQPDQRSWTVSEIVRHTARIRGIAGALLVTLDGLLIAAELSPELAADTLAAFVPQMFSRVTQYSKELKFGDPRHLTFIIEETPILIFKSGCVYFAVLGLAGEALPTVQLRAIAAALPRPDLSS